MERALETFLNVDHMRINRLREDNLCEGFSLAFISHVRCAFWEFCFITRNSKKPCQLQYDTRVKEFEEQHWGCSNTKTTKKNIIKFREGLSRPEDYSNDPLSPKLVIIDNLMRESLSWSWIFLPKAIITRISVLFLSCRIYSIRDVASVIYHLTRITSFSKIHAIALKFVI